MFLPRFLYVVLGLLPLVVSGCFWESTENEPDYLAMDDSRYPYSGLPRVVIETEDFAEIRDNETEHKAWLQVYGEKEADTKVLNLTVRGRGNSSIHMPKYGMKLEFDEKTSLFGMPANKDWAVIANFGDKTHLRNYMMFKLSEWLGARYTPKATFVELFLNRKYMGLYLFAETVKASKNRVPIAKTDSSFLLEKETEKKLDPPYITTGMGNQIHIKYPKNPSEESLQMIQEHLDAFENFLAMGGRKSETTVEDWVDLDDYLLYYWVQEFAKNEDGNFARSIFFSWEKGDVIHFGPLWDFDLGFGNASRDECQKWVNWYIRNNKWNWYLFRDSTVKEGAKKYWREHREVFRSLVDSVPGYVEMISKAIDNEYRRWPVLQNTENWALKDPYDTYDEALDAMTDWINRRFEWIETNLDENF